MNDDKKITPLHNQRMRGSGGSGPMVVEKAKDFKTTLKKLFIYMGGYRYALIIVAVFAVASAAFNILGPKIIGRATTLLAQGVMAKYTGNGQIDFGAISNIVLFLIGLYIFSAVFGVVQGFLMSGISQKIAFKMRRQMCEKIGRMPFGYFESKTVGEVLSRVTNDVDSVGSNLNQSINMLLSSVTTIIGALVMMVTISPLMTVIALVILPISTGIIGFIMKKSQKHFKTQQEYLGIINGQVEETFSGFMIIKAFGKQEDMQKEFKKNNDVLYTSAWKSQFFSGLMQPVMVFVGNLGYVGVVISGAFLALKKVIEIGDILAFTSYVRNFTQPIAQMAQVGNMVQSIMAAAERVFEFLEEEEEQQLEKADITIDKLRGNFTFKDITFGYKPETPVIKHFNSQVKDGQTVAIVGPTGAGKTTIVKLLTRFYDVNSGHILLDDIDINMIERDKLRSIFGMVLQDTWLFKGSIMNNIRYGKLDATYEEVIAAAKAARAHHFIKALPDGYHMELNEDATNVSAGQKQLLTIARAILANRRVLILDEATSSVDTMTERRIQEGMNNLMKGRTSFVIAHRLSTIRDADLILVMNNGDIVEQGTHDELMDLKGFYAELYQSQFINSAA